MALSSLDTQCRAFAQPIIKPMISSIRVQEWGSEWRLSSQVPRAVPRSVGIATDQPTSPIMPDPNPTQILASPTPTAIFLPVLEKQLPILHLGRLYLLEDAVLVNEPRAWLLDRAA
jgi:hypothetical protein